VATCSWLVQLTEAFLAYPPEGREFMSVSRSHSSPSSAASRADCQLQPEGFFHDLPQASLASWDAVSLLNIYPEGAVLFSEGQLARGIYILLRGRVKLSVVSGEGRSLIVRIAESGDALGLTACVLGKPYELTAESLSPCHVAFIRQEDLLRLLREDSESCFRVAEQVSREYRAACRELSCVGMSRSAHWKLANLLLGWCPEKADGAGRPAVVKLSLTHEEIAQMVGTSRETVTRVLTRFRKARLIEIHGSTLVIRDIAGLRTLAGENSAASPQSAFPPRIHLGVA
jgi:CRP/FNR family cyclic AMP-dependent transcriptional regulator